jgi:hypothetical protein
MIEGTFTLSLEEDGQLANLKLKAYDDNPEFTQWLKVAYGVESKMTPLSISTGGGETETFIVIRTP